MHQHQLKVVETVEGYCVGRGQLVFNVIYVESELVTAGFLL